MNSTAPKTATHILKLRQLAEELIGGSAEISSTQHQIVHELQVHQLELELQNQALQDECYLAEIALQRYRTLFDYALDAIFVLRNTWQIEEMNPACLRLWHATKPEEILKKHMLSLFHPDSKATISQQIVNAINQQTVQEFTEVKIVCLDGAYTQAQTAILPFKDEQGPLLFLICMDLTERCSVEAALIKSKNKHQAATHNLEAIREAERSRIALEIHDELGSTLTVLKMDLCTLETQIPLESESLRQQLQSMALQVDHGIQAIKRIITDLRPSILDQLGLFPAIEWQIATFRKRTGIACQLQIPEQELTLDPKRTTAVFRITQEILTNISRHAQATQVRVMIRVDSQLQLTISDNGCGIHPAKMDSLEGFGILGMRERANYFGGDLVIQSYPGIGTTVMLTLPL